MKKLIILLLFATFCTAQYKVVKIKDGDTIVVLDNTNTQLTIRVAGIDCPEKNQDFGQVAKQFTADQVFGKDVNIEKVSTDRYGRTVAFVLYENKNLSEELLKSGLAWHYKEYDKSKYLQDLEENARKNKIGLWIIENPTKPSEFRKK